MKNIYPVITLVIYYSPKPWNTYKDLYSFLGIEDNEILKKYVSNYKLNIIEPYKLGKDDYLKLNDELALLFEAINNSDDKEGFKKNIIENDKFKKIGYETIMLISEIIGLEIDIKEEAEVDMCKAWNDLLKDSREEGRAEGIEEGRAEGIEVGKAEGKAEGIIEGKAQGKAEGIEVGKAQGKAEGKNEALKESIKTMYSNGFDDKTIARALSLDLLFVKKVLAV